MYIDENLLFALYWLRKKQQQKFPPKYSSNNVPFCLVKWMHRYTPSLHLKIPLSQGIALPSARFWCDKTDGCLVTGTSLESCMIMMTRVRGPPHKLVMHICMYLLGLGIGVSCQQTPRGAGDIKQQKCLRDRYRYSQTFGAPCALYNCTGLHLKHSASKAVKPQSEGGSCEEALNFTGFLKMEPLTAAGVRGSQHGRFVS